MRLTRRRSRRQDPLASVVAVQGVLDLLASSLPDIIPRSQKNLVSMLQSIRNLSARPATDTKRGRPLKFPRENLLKVDAHLRMLLSRETSISVRSFVGQYLPILDFPRDVREPLERGKVNLFEAHQLARLTARRLGVTDGEARSHRRKLLEAHLRAQGSGARLRERVKESLGELTEPSVIEAERAAVEKVDELLEADPLDSTHLFFEELRRISRALRQIEPEDLDRGGCGFRDADLGSVERHTLPDRGAEEAADAAVEEAGDLIHPPLVAVRGVAFPPAIKSAVPEPQGQKAH